MDSESVITDTEVVYEVATRDKWERPLEFLLSCIGFSVGLGNVWRFPYLCYKHGGAPFLMAYLFLQLTIGKPLYFLELSMGQYSGKSAVRVWDMCPLFRGVGFSMLVISLNIALYYNIIMAYILYYFFASFIPTLPWTVCQPEWENCFEKIGQNNFSICVKPSETVSRSPEDCTCTSDSKINDLYPNCKEPMVHASAMFFDRTVVKQSDSIENFGVPSWKLMLLVFLSWIIVIVSLIKGIKSSGKVVYFTATFPYVILLVLLVRGALLDGAYDGATLFIVPVWEKLGSFQLWIDAAGQMFFSLGLSMGGILMYASYNPYHHPAYRDAVIISSMDLFTSVLAGFVIFTTIGYMAKQAGRDILKVIESSYGLAFVAYPETLSTLAWPNFWSCMFFFMLFTLGLDSQFALMETVIAYAIDDLKWCRRNSVQFRVGMCVVLCLLGLPLICPGGPYLITMLDIYGASIILTFVGLWEIVAVAWVYGIKRFINNLEHMLGRKPHFLPFWYFTWVVWSPTFYLGLLLVTAVRMETPSYRDGSHFGTTMLTMCWLVFFYTLLPIPLWVALHSRVTIKRKGPFATWKAFFNKLLEPTDRWGPADGTNPYFQSRKASVWGDVLGTQKEDDINAEFPQPTAKDFTSTTATAEPVNDQPVEEKVVVNDQPAEEEVVVPEPQDQSLRRSNSSNVD